ncbi:MAG TPA: transposase [Anaerolineaceae bacterium]|nr:transposase [Anaerolineaceae bacterium]
MPEYRRAQVPGGTFFITIVTYKRSPIFNHHRARAILHKSWQEVSKRFPFTTDAICLLPDHLHVLITLPDDESNFSIRIREIKRLFTKAYLAEFGSNNPGNQSRIDKSEATIWQRRFYEHTIRDERDLNTHIDYIHYNPVKHGLVDRASQWQWSSFDRYVQNGFLLAGVG